MSRSPKIAAYVLAADPTWVRSSLLRYYDHVDAILISTPTADRGWTGRLVPAPECVAAVRSLDTRGIVRTVRADWQRPDNPLAGETAQRQHAIDALSGDVDWILQIDSDEILPAIDPLLAMLAEAGPEIQGVEWPMRVLYRRLRDGRYLDVRTGSGAPHHEYPGPIAVRSGARLAYARRVAGPFVRAVIASDRESLQLTRPVEPDETRVSLDDPATAILHNSWARSPEAVRSKIASWGHNQGLSTKAYYYSTWLPTPLRWRRMRNFHPFAAALWPRLGVCDADFERLLDPADRA